MRPSDEQVMGVRRLGTAFHAVRRACQELVDTRAETARLLETLVREPRVRVEDRQADWTDRCARRLVALTASMSMSEALAVASGLAKVPGLRKLAPEAAALEVHVPGPR